jgi:hypothetical protein
LRRRCREFVAELNSTANDVATEVRAYYRLRGYFLAQAYLPEQTIRNGVVEISIIEGRWGVIELDKKPATRISTRLLAGILGAHLQQGGVITETGLERPLLLINDLPDASVTTELRPSETVGAAHLPVNVEPGAGPITARRRRHHGNRHRRVPLLSRSTGTSPRSGATASPFAASPPTGRWYGRVAYDLPVGPGARGLRFEGSTTPSARTSRR